jgi:spore coat polysaccharide biosynthesis protein SpsF (cytidylyltransferase family)
VKTEYRFTSSHTVLMGIQKHAMVIYNVDRLLSSKKEITLLVVFTGSELLDHCMACCYDENTAVIAMATEMLAGIVADKWKGIGSSKIF